MTNEEIKIPELHLSTIRCSSIIESITINKDDIQIDTEESDRGIRRTYKYICPENSIIIINGKDTNEGINGINIQ